jgi:hypothetical protein
MAPNTNNSLNVCSSSKEIVSKDSSKTSVLPPPPDVVQPSSRNSVAADVSSSDVCTAKPWNIPPNPTTSLPVMNSPVDTFTNGHALLNHPWASSNNSMMMMTPPYTPTSLYSPSPYTPSGFPYGSPFNPWGLSATTLPTDPSSGGIVTNTLQLLFSIQSVIVSLGQVVQIIGSNTSALDHLYQQCNGLVRSWWKRMENLSSHVLELDSSRLIIRRDDEEKRRRRMKAVRYGLMLCASLLGYRWVHVWWRRRSEYVRYLQYSQNIAMDKKRI